MIGACCIVPIQGKCVAERPSVSMVHRLISRADDGTVVGGCEDGAVREWRGGVLVRTTRRAFSDEHAELLAVLPDGSIASGTPSWEDAG